jgi:membrane-bound lytic murein transglycosylase D
MNSTRGRRGAAHGAFRLLLGGVLVWLTMARVLAADADTAMPRPPELERDVHFWIRVYTEVDTNGGFLHDQYNLAVVYDTLHFAAKTSPPDCGGEGRSSFRR